MEFDLALADKSHFSGCHTFQHCSNTFKPAEQTCLMFKPQYKQLINMDGIEPKASDVRKSRSIITPSSFAFWAIASHISQLLKYDTNTVASYHVVPYLQRCYASLVTSNAVHDYWKCYINVVTRTCSGFYWYICTLPRALRALGIVRIYQLTL